MRNDTSPEAIYDLIRARGVTIRDYSLSVTDHSVRLGGEVRSYYQAQLTLNVVSSAYEGWEIVNNLVVHSVDSDDDRVPQPPVGARTDIPPGAPLSTFCRE